MNDQQKISRIRFEWHTDEQPVFDVGWEPVLSDSGEALWRVSVSGDLAELRPHLEQRRQLTMVWENYAEAVAQAVRRPDMGVDERTTRPVEGDEEDIAARLMGYAERLLRKPLVVETVVDGEQLAQTRVAWETGEMETGWRFDDVQDDLVWLHTASVEVAGRTILALAQREGAVGLAIVDASKQIAQAKATVIAQANSVKVPTKGPLMATPSLDVQTPYIVTRQSMLGIDWCWVPGGVFTMGGEQFDDEKPIHDVNVDGFWMMRYPVTNGQYRQFIEAGGYADEKWWTAAGWAERQEAGWREPRYWKDSQWNGAEQPVVGVSWYEAVAFCQWASEITGREIRLPTEAEWEKAARGTDGREYPWGNEQPNKELCNFGGYEGQTTPVGTYSPMGDSPYGCTDMAGNVYDWCVTLYRDYPYEANDGRNDLDGEGSRMLRGGSWYDLNNYVRAAYRDWDLADNGYDDLGFRCASTPF